MPLDPVIIALAERMPDFLTYRIWERTPQEARDLYRKFCDASEPHDITIGKSESVEAPGPARPIMLRAYTPVAAGSAALPAIVYFHGGGFVMGDLETHDALCRTMTNTSGCRVFSVDYRLAPEFVFPAAIEDAFAAVKWIEENAVELGVDPNDIAVAGDSAGGNIAAVVCLLAKQNRDSPHIAFQLLFYPSIRLTREFVTRPFGSGYRLDDRAIHWFYSQYIPPDVDTSDARLSPIEAKDLSGLPPAYILTAGCDPLRDEAIAYGAKLKQAGVNVTHVDYPTMIHGFLAMQNWIPLAGEALSAAGKAVKEALK
jgi:acetyl esterase